mgnify:CR=1 FL=1
MAATEVQSSEQKPPGTDKSTALPGHISAQSQTSVPVSKHKPHRQKTPLVSRDKSALTEKVHASKHGAPSSGSGEKTTPSAPKKTEHKTHGTKDKRPVDPFKTTPTEKASVHASHKKHRSAPGNPQAPIIEKIPQVFDPKQKTFAKYKKTKELFLAKPQTPGRSFWESSNRS